MNELLSPPLAETDLTILHPINKASPTLFKRSSETAPISTSESDKLPELREGFKQEIAEMAKGTTGEIIISAHTTPDEDAIGSAVAQKRILERLNPGKHFKVVFSELRIDAWDDFLRPDEITWAAAKKVKPPNGKGRLGDMIDHVKKDDAVILVDNGTLDRFSKFPGQIQRVGNGKVALLDHHLGEPPSVTTSYVEPTSTSASEIIARMYGPEQLTADEAELLLLGILGDTQSFQIAGDHTETKVLAEQLRGKVGKSYEEIMGKVRHSEREAVHRKEFENNAKTYEAPHSPSQTYSYLTAKEEVETIPTVNGRYDRGRARKEYVEEAARTGKTDLYWTIASIKKDEKTAISTEYNIQLRRGPTSTVDLNALAANWGGGGHAGSAAGTYKLSPEQFEDVKQKKQADTNFDETAYICGIIAKDIADRLATPSEPEPALVTHQEPQSHVPIPEPIQTETTPSQPEEASGTETHAEHHAASHETNAHTPSPEHLKSQVHETQPQTPPRPTAPFPEPEPVKLTRMQRIQKKVRAFFSGIRTSWKGFGNRIKSFFSQFLR